MNKVFLVISGILSFLTVSYSQLQEENRVIAFYNVENLFHPSDEPYKFDEDFTPKGAFQYTEDRYEQKLKNLTRVLSQIGKEETPHGFSILGVAEVENALVIRALLEQKPLNSRPLKYVHFDSPDSRGIDVALIYRADHFKLLHAEAIHVPLIKSGKEQATRDMLYVTGIMEPDTLHIIVVHWPSRFGGEAASSWKRMTAAHIAKVKLDSISNHSTNAKIILMGDFNDDPVSQSIKSGLGANWDKKELKGNELFNPWYGMYKKGRGTLGYNDSWNLFDQILISKSLMGYNQSHWKWKNAVIFKPSYLKHSFGINKGYPLRTYIGNIWMNGYSDHFPTYITIVKSK